MSAIKVILRSLLSVAVTLAAASPAWAATPRPPSCQRIQLTGEVQSGQQWSSPFGKGWLFRVVPVEPGKEGYSGWDLVIDRENSAGYPDALLVASPPYYSIGEREVGTTFGLRAQDAIGWNPRSFHFLTDPEALRESQKLFRNLGSPKIWSEKPEPDPRRQSAMQALQQLNRKSSPGEFRILNARLTPGTANPQPFAQRWALQAARTPHTNVPSPTGTSSALGQLISIRFSITLWLPAGWPPPKGLATTPAPCPR